MKKEFTPGVVGIVYSNRRTLTKAQRAALHSFAPHYGEFTVFPRPGATQYLSFVTHLKDGSLHVYYYGPYVATTQVFTDEVICNGTPQPSLTEWFGGEFFNPTVRPTLVSKDISPP